MGGDTAQENVFRCSHWGGEDAENSKTEGGTTHKMKVGCWLAGSMIIVPILAPSCKLILSGFSAKLRIHDGAECGKNRNSSVVCFANIK